MTRPGDLWILGAHRLLCGDSSKPEDLDRLLAGAPIHLVNTDPPYNVKVEPRSRNAIAAGLSSFTAENAGSNENDGPRKLRTKDRLLANDFVSDEECDRLLNAWFGNIARVLQPGRTAYIWGGYANCGNLPSGAQRPWPVLQPGHHLGQAAPRGHTYVRTKRDSLHQFRQPAQTGGLKISGGFTRVPRSLPPRRLLFLEEHFWAEKEEREGATSQSRLHDHAT